ncbi:DMT family transporter [Chondrinema litorale]|uniref:DMT family transporter n=1 Tax=Chondrinema litorale TaxID=2994555 RepID=UPI0025429601|nr:DMT family transporter [Chondrinema litorale]UZR92544.1 DMT family transporter [Chondrinema litorale]
MKFQLSYGVRVMMLATFLFAVMNVCVKFVSHIPSVQIVFVRSIISLVLSLYFLKKAKIKIWGNNKKILLLRGIFGASALVMYFTTLHHMPLASAIIIQYTSPIFTAILTFLLLKEQVIKWQWLCFLISFLGILMIKSFDARIETIDLLMGVGAAVFSALAYTCIRVLKQSEHPLVIVLYFPLVTMPITGVYSLTNWVIPELNDWLFLIGIGILTQMAQLLMTKAFQAEAASRVASVNYTGVVYALSFGMIFFNEFFNWWVLAGMLTVITGVILNLIVSNKLISKNAS